MKCSAQKCILGIFVIGFFAVGSASAAHVATTAKPKAAPYVRIFYYRQGPLAQASFLAHPRSIDVFAPQSYALDDSGVLTGSVRPYLLAFARVNNIKVMPLVTNSNFSSTDGHALLNDPVKQDVAINALIAEASKQGYWGWQFDFEQLDFSYRDRYSAFIARAGNAFKAANLITSVAVIAQISQNPADYPEGRWQSIIGVYDYAALASSTDIVTVMAYDNPDRAGPIASYPWVKQVVAYSLQYIPSEKLSLGIPFYYWKWDTGTNKLVDIGGWQGIKNVLTKYGPTPHFSATDQTPYIKYTVKKKHYTLWYENARSIQKKLDLITANSLNGFSAWTLGLEIPDVHRVLKR